MMYAYYDATASHEPTFFYHSDHLGSAAYLTDDAGQVTQTLNYLPYGEDWVDKQNYDETQYPRLDIYAYNGKEKDYESGFHYYGARYYWSEVLTGWLSVDPMMDKYPSLSPYNYCVWNPVMLVDPDGRFVGDFYSMNCWGYWKKIGSDGKNDHRTYLVTNSKDIETIKSNTKKGNYTSVDEISETICLPSKDIRRQMSKVLDYDNNDNLREYGGKGFIDDNGDMFIRELEPGPLWSGLGNAEIDMTKLKDNDGINTNAVFWYHSHPSGEVDVDEINFNYIQPTPSDIDKINIEESGRKYDYVFGLHGRDPQVYIYNSSGIRAQLSVDEFKNIGE